MANLFDILSFAPPGQDSSSSDAQSVDKNQISNEKNRHNVDTSSDPISQAKVQPTLSPRQSPRRPGRPERKTGQNSDTSDSSTQDQSNLFEFDTLKQFTIPKKKKTKKELLEDIALDSREFKTDILPIISLSYKNRSASKSFKYSKVQLVHNDELLKKYLEKRKEMRQDGYTEKEVADSFAFLYTTSDRQIGRLVRDGIHIGNQSTSCLGQPKMGVSLSKHADILAPHQLSTNHPAKLIIFKMIKGKVKSVVECPGGSQLEPTPNFDCHVSKSGHLDLVALTAKQAFDSTQIYLYEYGDLGVETSPRQILPYAVVHFTYLGGCKTGGNKSMPKVSKSLSSPQAQPMQPNPSRGLAADQNGLIVWNGQLTNKNKEICNVNLVVYGTCLKPARIGPRLNVTARCVIPSAQLQYLSGVDSLKPDAELCHQGRYYSYGKLLPQGDPALLNHFCSFIERNKLICLSTLEDGVSLLLMTHNDIIKSLGLASSPDQPVLHCIFVSPVSRQNKLAGQKQNLQVTESSPRKSAYGFRSEPSTSAFSSPSTSKTAGRATVVPSMYDSGFQESAPPASLVNGTSIKKAFQDASTRQEQCNIAIARKNSASKLSATQGISPGHDKSLINKHVLAAAQMLTSGKKTTPVIQVTAGAPTEHIDPRLLKRQISLPSTVPTQVISDGATVVSGRMALQHSLSMPVLTPEVVVPPIIHRAGLSPIISSPRPDASPDVLSVKDSPIANPSITHRLSVGMSPTQQDSETTPVQSFASIDSGLTVSDALPRIPAYKSKSSHLSAIKTKSQATPDLTAVAMDAGCSDRAASDSENMAATDGGCVNDERREKSNQSHNTSRDNDNKTNDAQSSTAIDETVINLLQKYQMRKASEGKADSVCSSGTHSSHKSSLGSAADDEMGKRVATGDKKPRSEKKTKRKRTNSSHSSASSHSINLSDSEVDRIVKGPAVPNTTTSVSTSSSSATSSSATSCKESKVSPSKIQLTDLNFFPDPDVMAHKRVRRKSETLSKTTGKNSASTSKSGKDKPKESSSRRSPDKKSASSSHHHSSSKPSSTRSSLNIAQSVNEMKQLLDGNAGKKKIKSYLKTAKKKKVPTATLR